MSLRTPTSRRRGALLCAVLYFPCGLVWAYGLALFALPLVLLGFRLLRAAARSDADAGTAPDKVQRRLHAVARAALILDVVASLVALVATK